ncbi:PDDEXK nuclease domain-containing protein [bacterium]|nr:PDDEXK nuclease domain-containing protein [bacterium]
MDVPDEAYGQWLVQLKTRIQGAQLRAAQSVNSELVLLYWSIGRDILERQREHGWGARVIDRLSADLRREFPDLKGFSVRNLKYMRAFAEAWPEEAIVQQLVAQLPWGHNVRILDGTSGVEERLWYVKAALTHGWSRNMLVHQIESGLHLRQGQAVTNFAQTLPAPQSDLAREILKDPYNFDFLTMSDQAQERDLEHALLAQLRDALLEFGGGFAFVGSQYPLEVGGEDFFLDLLFYHLRLRCFVVVDLKVGKFRPEHAGKMNFYLSAVDDLLRHPSDQPSIGLILCKTRNGVVAEYALRDMRKPVGVANYRLGKALPDALQAALPSVQYLQTELQLADDDDSQS